MNKENILFGIIGILLGFIGGFFFANSVNRNATSAPAVAQTSPSAATSAQQPAPFASTGNQVSIPAVKDQPPNSNKPASAALPEVQKVIDAAKNEPDNFDAQIAAGKMFYKIQRFDEAAAYFERANQIQPANYEAITMIGNCYFDGEKFELAEKWYSAALAKKPDDYNVRTDLGLTFFLRQPPDIDRAIKEYRKSLETNPNHELTLQNLAVALQKKGDTPGLNEVLAQLVKVNPNNLALVKLRGQTTP